MCSSKISNEVNRAVETEGSSTCVLYNISTKTSKVVPEAGTKSNVSINLIGEQGSVSTGFLKLNRFLQHNFMRGKCDHFRKRAKDVGLPTVLRIKVAKGEWLCDYIIVSIGDNELNRVIFPIYDWIVDEMQVTRGQATLPQKLDNKYIRSMRKFEIQSNKNLFQWIPLPTEETIGWGLPRYMNANSYNELPKIFKRDKIREKNFKGKQFTAGVKFVLTLLKKKVVPIRSLDSYHQLHANLGGQNTNYVKDWNTDESFGRQVLSGINPLMVSKCTSLPSHFNVTKKDVEKYLSAGKTLKNEMAAGKIYISDYVDLLSGVKRNLSETGDPLYCADAVALFYVNSAGKFLPIAIQLVPNDRDYLFTPDDSISDWLLAKMYFRGASASTHEWVYHYLLTHSIMEPFSIALFRCFPRSHPLYKLLRPHLLTVSAMNADARDTLISTESAANKIIAINATSLARKAYKKITFNDLVISKALNKKGTNDATLLPNFHYRDDVITLWKIMEDYVTKVIRHYYSSDADVQGDVELQDWAQDVAINGLGWEDKNTRGMPKQIAKIYQLIEICVTLMFTSSAQHAAVNFGQFETYKFIPNAPLGMRKPPHKKGEANEKRILESLPNAFQAITAIAITYTLSAFSEDEKFLGDYPDQLFTDQEVLNMQQEFKNKLAEASLKINVRNDVLEHKYTFLLPERVPNSIAI